MFCPYIRKTYTRVIGINYNEELLEDGSILYENYTNEKCKKENCGAWFDGRCRYNEQ